MKRMVFTMGLLLSLTLFAIAPVRAENLRTGDAAAIEKVIRSQLAAFLQDQATAAYQHASPMIQNMFPDKRIFMAMVRQGYPQIYRSQQAIFATIQIDKGRIIHP